MPSVVMVGRIQQECLLLLGCTQQHLVFFFCLDAREVVLARDIHCMLHHPEVVVPGVEREGGARHSRPSRYPRRLPSLARVWWERNKQKQCTCTLATQSPQRVTLSLLSRYVPPLLFLFVPVARLGQKPNFHLSLDPARSVALHLEPQRGRTLSTSIRETGVRVTERKRTSLLHAFNGEGGGGDQTYVSMWLMMSTSVS